MPRFYHETGWDFLQLYQTSDGRRFELYRRTAPTEGRWTAVQFVASPSDSKKVRIFFQLGLGVSVELTKRDIIGETIPFLQKSGFNHFILYLEEASYGEEGQVFIDANTSEVDYVPNIKHLIRMERQRVEIQSLELLEEALYEQKQFVLEKELTEYCHCSQSVLSQALNFLKEDGLVSTLGQGRWTITKKGVMKIEASDPSMITTENSSTEAGLTAVTRSFE